MFVDYWGVGLTNATSVPLTISDISGHLLLDWLPSLPSSVGTSFIGWPPFLMENRQINGRNVLLLRRVAGRTERQWKGFLSWMLGIAGTRQVLQLESYRWIAPVSAFYPEASYSVDLSAWNPTFPKASLLAEPNPASASRLRPDYFALRSTSGGTYDWTVAESKGTRLSIAYLSNCPPAWADQARNVIVRLNGIVLQIPRHMVVATRVNPNARSESARCIQLRAWNRKEEDPKSDKVPRAIGPDIAAAHLFGLLRGLHLNENARALALSVQARTQARLGRILESTRRSIGSIGQRCDDELRQRTIDNPKRSDGFISHVVSVETARGAIQVEILAPLLVLARKLQQAQEDDTAADALEEADSQLDKWEIPRRSAQHGQTDVWLPFGVELRLPADFIRP